MRAGIYTGLRGGQAKGEKNEVELQALYVALAAADAVRNSPTRQIVRRKLYRHDVSGKNLY
jgi:hypothetical protein